jgi:transposase
MLGPMRPPAKIKPWLNPSQLTDWVCAASIDAGLRRKRLAVWLSAVRSFYAHQVAALLGVSVVSVWRWISCYNRSGPEGLRASRRGGRHRGHLGSRVQEASVLARWEPQALAGDLLTAGPLRQALEQVAGRRLSPSSLYELLARHEWRKVAPRPRHPQNEPETLRAYKKKLRCHLAAGHGRAAPPSGPAFRLALPGRSALWAHQRGASPLLGAVSSTAARGPSSRAPVRVCRRGRQPLGRSTLQPGLALDERPNHEPVPTSCRPQLCHRALRDVPRPSRVAFGDRTARASKDPPVQFARVQPGARIRSRTSGNTSAKPTSDRVLSTRCRRWKSDCVGRFRHSTSNRRSFSLSAVTGGFGRSQPVPYRPIRSSPRKLSL